MPLVSIRYLTLIASAAIFVLSLFFYDHYWLPLLAGALTLLGISDLLQTKHALRRNYPILALFRYTFESVRPAGYPVPVDGPCGELLAAQGRHTMRPAHLHFLIVAPGHKVLATQFFDIDDPHAHDDVVFGAVGSLLRQFEPADDGDGFKLDVELRLEPGETRIPKCPIP